MIPPPPPHRWSCDKGVVRLLKWRTLSSLHDSLEGQHTEEWALRSLRYFAVLDKLPVVDPQQVSLPPMHPVPSVPCLISLYVRKGLNQLEETKARATSIFGDILKMDSTKKASF